MKVQEIRDRFTQYFINKSHEKLASSPLVPQGDDTLLFTNAGMNQFKDIFTGKEKPKSKRAVTIQKVVRAGGKHNDLENVGLTARHHTFFEMLGNFSFGDYFKKEAIEMSWDFLTKELGLNPDKLYVTVHHTDDEAFELWQKHIGLSADRIFRKGDKDNFWEMGDVGPCGPCSEIFYDHGKEYTTEGFIPGEGQDMLDDELRYVEIWNLVFMQFEKDGKGGRTNLPNPSIDTGMGLERIAAVMQGVYWNYDTDAFTPIIKEIERLTQKSYASSKNQASIRIVADHIRSSTMLITDGVIPSNEGRGYVLRRIIRRAVRHLKNLEAPKGTFAHLSEVVMKELGTEYPQNASNLSMAKKFLELEETKFLETLDQGLRYLEDAIKKDVKDNILPGHAAFMLYDTYGFPLDLTEVILQERGMSVDMKGFDAAMKERKEDSKKSWKGSFNLDDKIFHAAKSECGATNFTGYDSLRGSGKLQKIIDLGEMDGLVFDQTPFYAEGGGQVGDIGLVNENVKITDTQKPVDELWVHFCDKNHDLKEGESYDLCVDPIAREQTTKNHSATHLLQAALIEVLGDHVKQSGSLVGPNRLRFDFTHMKALTNEEINQVEKLVNKQISSSLEVSATVTSKENALKKGALALFGEKYGDSVRVLEMGKFSVEFCGGTHVQNTSEIGLFSIVSESSLSTGVRRIEALTSQNAIDRLKSRSEYLASIESLVSTKDANAVTSVQTLQADLKKMQKQMNDLKKELMGAKSKDLFQDPEMIGSTPFKYAHAPEKADLRALSDKFMDKNPNGVVLLSSENKGKMAVLLRAGKNVGLPCNKILKETLPLIDGRGGGKPDMAQGSGDGSKINDFVTKAKELIQSNLG